MTGVNSIVRLTDVITFAPNERFSGPATISVLGLDTTNTPSNVAYLNIVVNFVNTPPQINGRSDLVCSLGKTCSISYTINDPDVGDVQNGD